MIPEREREALMRLTMCARSSCRICKYDCEDFEECEKRITKNMNILANALRVADTPQTEICDTCKYRSSNVFGNWCVGRNTCDRYEADTPQTETSTNSEKLQLAVEPQTDCGWK